MKQFLLLLLFILKLGMVIHAQVSKNITATAGSLSSLLTVSEKSTITDLTVTGTIDARDFKTMRDMLQLQNIDLDSATIAAYTGAEGPLSYETTYLANEIPYYAFSGDTNLVDVTLPITITAINNYAFYYCRKLSSISQLSSSINRIGYAAFMECTLLDSLTIPASVSTIASYAFRNCSALLTVQSSNSNYSSNSGVLFNKDQTSLIQCPISKSGNYTTLSSVTTIGAYAFSNCSNLNSITIASGVNSIGTSAFYLVHAAIQVDESNSYYSSTEGVLFDKDQTTVLFCPISKSGSYVIPSTVTTIGNSAFYSCDSLTSITIPYLVTIIGTSAFSQCTAIDTIHVNVSVPPTVGTSAFYNVSKDSCILSVPYKTASTYSKTSGWKDFKNIIEDSIGFVLDVNQINFNASGGKDTIYITSNVDWNATSDQSWMTGSKNGNKIILAATENTSELQRTATVTVSATNVPDQLISITQDGHSKEIEVTAGNLSSILTDDELNGLTNLVLKGTIDARDFKTMRDSMPVLSILDLDSVTIVSYTGTQGTASTSSYSYAANTVPDYAFYYSSEGKTSLQVISLPLTVTSIGYYAFESCSGLTTLTLPESLISISYCAFDGTTSLENIEIPASVTSIDNYTFRNSSGTITVDGNNTNYSSYNGTLLNKSQTSFIQCPIIKDGDFELPSTVTTIQYYAFYNCTQLSSVSIPSTVTSIYSYAFRNCSGLINVDESNTEYSSIDGVLFNKTQTTLIQCPTYKTATYAIPSTVTTLDVYAFYNCSGFDSITIPTSVQTINNYAFYNCSGLKSITTEAVTPIDLSSNYNVFYNIDKTSCTLNVPYGTKTRYSSAYQWKDFTNIVEASTGILLDSSEVNFDVVGGTDTIQLTSNVTWTASADNEWVTVNPVNGTGNSQLYLSVDANPNCFTRTATITVSADGVTSQFIKLNQRGLPKEIDISEGELDSVLTTEELNGITDLTITGTIDARDFKTMRDSMPLLENIDISATNVVAYSGTEGTYSYGTNTYYYSANEIPQYAFYNTTTSKGKTTLKSILLPTTLTGIDNHSFSACSNLTDIDIPLAVNNIGYYSFNGCTKLDSINLPSSLKTIGGYAFYNCDGLKTVTLPSSVTSVGSGIFRECDSLQTVTILSPITSITSQMFYYCRSLTSVTIPSTITTIGSYAFYYCSKLQAITLPSSLKTIGSSAFYYCSSLDSIYIPESVTSIAEGAFIHSSARFVVDSNNESYSSNDYVLFNKGQTKLIQCPISKSGNYSIPSSVNSIASYAFYYCSNINAIHTSSSIPIDLSSSVYVFNGMDKTNCILYVPYLTKTRYEAADQWQDFTNIIEDSEGFSIDKTTLDYTADGGNDTITISANTNWSATSDQTWLSITPSTGSTDQILIATADANSFAYARSAYITITSSGDSSQTVLVTQKGLPKTIKLTTAGTLTSKLTTLELAGITNLTITGKIDARDFKTMRDEMPLLEEINLNGATIVAYTGKEGTASATSNYTYPANTVPEKAFYIYDEITYNSSGKTSLKSFVFPSSVSSIGNYALYGCTGLSSIEIPSLMTGIGYCAFASCFGLTSITIPESVSTIGYSAFSGCSKLTTIDLPASLTTISSSLLSYCTNLTSVTIPESVISIQGSAFYDCTGLTTVTIPKSVISIGGSAFGYCTGLTTIIIPSTVTSIDGYAFDGCSFLKSITACPIYPIDLTNSNEVFRNVSKYSCKLYVPYQTKERYAVADQWEDFLNIEEDATGILLDTTAINFDMNGGTDSVKVISNLNWTVSVAESWINVNPTTGQDNDDLVITINATDVCYTRTAQITVYTENDDSITLVITQEGLPKTIECTAGQLASLLSEEELAGITNLTITGTIDARDFKTMRDDMPLLSVIDLSGATIVAYTGTKGTESSSYTCTYNANAVPQYAFFSPSNYTGKTSLQSITLPASVTSIGNYGFRSCTGLSTISIPSSVTSIGSYCFWYCTGLTSIYAYPVTPVGLTSSYNVFYNVDKTTCILYVPYGSLEDYQVADQWEDFYNIIEIKEPVANAGEDQTVNEGTLVHLDGTASTDPDGNTLTYQWTAPAGITLSFDTIAQPTFTAPEVKADTTYTISLVVNNGATSSVIDQIRITVLQVNKAPVANAGADQTVDEGTVVTLDASASYDPDDDAITYLWTVPSGISLSSKTKVKPTITAPHVNNDTTYTFILFVEDESGATDNDTVSITVMGNMARILDVQLTDADSVAIDQSSSTVVLYMPYAYDVRALSPAFDITSGASILPESETTNDFSTDILYTVTSEDGLVKRTYTVTVYKPTVSLSTNIESGWNWISMGVEIADDDILSLMSSLSYDNYDYIKTATSSAIYYSATGWFGDLQVDNSLGMLMLKKGTSDILNITGNEINPTITEIPIVAGWNRIGYLLKGNAPLSGVFDISILPDGNLVLKGKDAVAVYYPGTGWIGDLDSLKVLNGYMLYSDTTGKVVYLADNMNLKSSSLSQLTSTNKELLSEFQISPSDFENSAIVIGEVVNQENENIVSDGDLFVAYAEDIPCGVAESKFIPELNKSIFILSVFSNATNENISFHFVKSTEASNEKIVQECIQMKTDGIYGDPMIPYKFHVNQTTTQVNIHGNDVAIYPNPASDEVHIAVTGKITSCSLVSLTGIILITENNISDNCFQFNLSTIPDGVYLLKVKTEDGLIIKKLIKSSK